MEGYAGLSCFDHEMRHECRSYQIEDPPSHISHVHHQMGLRQECSKISGGYNGENSQVPTVFPLWKWREDDEEVAPPVPPPAAPVDVPTPSVLSSPEPSRKELMRALRRNECIMRRHEQLMLMLHPGLDTSGFKQISSLDISQNPQGQRAESAEKENAEEDDDFQSAEATGDASTFAREESADDE
ncbi:hypothetical protein PIB30_077687 [Stylosanthes scabra]|uniref:Uncharacterized protein n=1 Tax=Stylosanthes scabra TaxID=79078 RepID=A0ABU6TQ57_9FABA|nr:hypothetical protein [Stylosanthes scabra]